MLPPTPRWSRALRSRRLVLKLRDPPGCKQNGCARDLRYLVPGTMSMSGLHGLYGRPTGGVEGAASRILNMGDSFSVIVLACPFALQASPRVHFLRISPLRHAQHKQRTIPTSPTRTQRS